MIALMLVTDGRKECCESTLASLDALIGIRSFGLKLVVDDSCDPEYSAWLDTVVDWDVHLQPEARKRGFGGAINAGWDALLRSNGPPDYIFHLEDDFMMVRYFNFHHMVKILEENPHIQQIALKRQSWNDTEKAAGGLVQVNWDAYTQHN
jgi:hypothetical protein